MTDVQAVQRVCAVCWQPLEPGAERCAKCGTQVASAAAVLPRSRAAAWSVWFGLMPFGVNLISNVAFKVLDPMLASVATTDPRYWPTWAGYMFVLLLSRLVNLALLVLTFVAAVRGLRETRSGAVAGRGRAIFGLVLGCIGAASYLVTLGILIASFARDFMSAF